VLSLQQLSDRIEIQDLMTAYCRTIDRQDWDNYPSLFTDDAYVDYSGTGGGKGTVAEILTFLSDAFAMVSACQHMVSNFEVELDGDSADVRCLLHNPMIFGEGEAANTHLFGVWYMLKLSKLGDRWLIQDLQQELSYSAGPLG